MKWNRRARVGERVVWLSHGMARGKPGTIRTVRRAPLYGSQIAARFECQVTWDDTLPSRTSDDSAYWFPCGCLECI